MLLSSRQFGVSSTRPSNFGPPAGTPCVPVVEPTMPAPVADPIPVRALNQATYCPRLYYLQYVDCVMPTNEHVEAGLHDHRRVDAPALKGKARKEGEAVRTRGLALASRGARPDRRAGPVRGDQRPGVPGRDQARDQHPATPTATPRPGTTTPSNCAPKPCCWRRAAGCPSRKASQFYAGSRERVPVAFTPELRRITLDTVQLCRDLAVSDAPPPPLPADKRHRCFGCSLAPVLPAGRGPCSRSAGPPPTSRSTRRSPGSSPRATTGRCCTCKSRAATSASGARC